MKTISCNKGFICEHCKGEIYDNDFICNLNEVYGDGDFIVHEECVADSISENAEKAHEYIFDDLYKISEVFEKLLQKYVAWEFFECMEVDFNDFS